MKTLRENFSPGFRLPRSKRPPPFSFWSCSRSLGERLRKPPRWLEIFSGRVTDMSVPTPVSGFEHLLLRVVEAGRERADRGDDEADADAEAERGEQRAALPAPQLGEHVGEVEHDWLLLACRLSA